jgi:hypothetical protein
MVAGTGSGDVEQVALGVVDLFQVGVVGHRFDPFLRGNDLVVAGHDDNRSELQTFGEVHGADRNVAAHCLNVFVKHFIGELGLLCRRASTVYLGGRADEQADLVGCDALSYSIRKPLGDCFYLFFGSLIRDDLRFRPVEYRDCAPPVFHIAVHIGQLRPQESVGVHSDLVRRPVVDSQRPGTATDIDAESLPGKGLLEDPLAEVACEEKAT